MAAVLLVQPYQLSGTIFQLQSLKQTVCLHSVVDSRHICLLLLLKTVVNCNVANASVSSHTFSFMALYKFVFNFNFNLTQHKVWYSTTEAATHAERAVGHTDSTVRDKHGVFDVALGHVSAEVRSVFVITHHHIYGVVVGVHSSHVQGRPAGTTSIHCKLRPLVYHHTRTLQTWPWRLHLTHSRQENLAVARENMLQPGQLPLQ